MGLQLQKVSLEGTKSYDEVKMELSNVNFLGYISHNEVPRYLSGTTNDT